jgi:hypothetical protein
MIQAPGLSLVRKSGAFLSANCETPSRRVGSFFGPKYHTRVEALAYALINRYKSFITQDPVANGIKLFPP